MSSSDGLRNIVQQRLHTDVFETACSKWKGWMILVVDAVGLRMISSAMGMYDLMEHRVTTVENLGMKRAPFKDMAVIYLIAPTEESIQRVIDDWTDESKRLYANAVFLNFLYRVPDELVSKLKTCRNLLKRLKVFTEVNVDFIVKESHAFHLDMKHSLSLIYGGESDSVVSHQEEQVIQKLVTFFATLNEYPYIRHKNDSVVGGRTANNLQRAMNDFLRVNTSWWYYGDSKHNSRERCTFVLLDRKEDPLSPLLHEFTYQAMVSDLLPMDGDQLTYKVPEASSKEGGDEGGTETGKKDVLLNDSDEVWVEFRHKHIADVMQTVSKRMTDIISNNKASKLQNKDEKTNMSVAELASALKGLPEYRELVSKLNQHMHIANECFGKYNSGKLGELGELEQTLATGQDEDGKTPKLSELIDEIAAILPTLSTSNKIRLLCIAFISQRGHLEEGHKSKIYDAAALSSTDKAVLDNLTLLGITTADQDAAPVDTATKFGNLFGGKKLRAVTNQLVSNSEYAACRYVTKLKVILDAMVNDRLSPDDFPGTQPLPTFKTTTAASVRTRVTPNITKHSKWSKDKNRQKKKSYTGGRQIVFILGGISMSEIRAGYELMEVGEKEIILGSTEFLNPDSYLDELRTLS